MFKTFNSYITGYYGMLNTGDDVLLNCTRWAAKYLLNDSNHCVSSTSFIKNEEFGDIEPIPSSGYRGQLRLAHYKNALLSEKVIFGGGSVLHSEKDIQLKRHLIALAGKKNSRCAGVGVGPFESVAAERACAKFLNECGHVGIRDEESFQIATALAPKANIKLTFDLAPLMLCHQNQRPVEIERKGIMFNFCQQAIDPFGNVNSENERNRIECAVTAIEKTWQETHEPITLLDFNGHPVFGDFHLHKKIMVRLAGNIPVSHIEYDPNPFRVLQRIAGFKASVSMRLHAAILSFMANTPALSINYHNKCYAWCRQVGVPQDYQFDAVDFCPETLALTLQKGIGIGFALPTMKTEEAVKATLLNWRSSDESNAIYSRYTTLQQGQ